MAPERPTWALEVLLRGSPEARQEIVGSRWSGPTQRFIPEETWAQRGGVCTRSFGGLKAHWTGILACIYMPI